MKCKIIRFILDEKLADIHAIENTIESKVKDIDNLVMVTQSQNGTLITLIVWYE